MFGVRSCAVAAAWCALGVAASAQDAGLNPRLQGDSPPVISTPILRTTHGGIVSDGPRCGVISSKLDDTGSIWLGHFTGGRVGPAGPIPGGVEWKDIYACFRTRNDCAAWQREERSAYHGLEGYRTCLVIR